MSFNPMLAVDISKDQLEKYIKDDTYVMQRKIDGERIAVEITDGNIRFLNRMGKPKALAMSGNIVRSFRSINEGYWIFDAELLNGNIFIFDLARAGDTITPKTPFGERFLALELFMDIWNHDKAITILDCARTTEEKQFLFDYAQANRYEGVILRNLNGAYKGGESNDLGRYKFTKDADVVIYDNSAEGKASVTLAVYHNDLTKIIEVGHASTIGKRPTPGIGQVWKVSYLYILDENKPKLVQARLMEQRLDKPMKQCTMAQFKGMATNKD